MLFACAHCHTDTHKQYHSRSKRAGDCIVQETMSIGTESVLRRGSGGRGWRRKGEGGQRVEEALDVLRSHGIQLCIRRRWRR